MGAPLGLLARSTDGGQTFTPVPPIGPGLPTLNPEVVAVSPDDPDHVLLAGNREGFILETTDGGTMWTVVNDPHAPGGRNFLSEGVGDLEIPPAASSALPAGPVRATVTGASTLVGTGGGLFAAAFPGGAATPCATAADCGDDDPCTTDACVDGACKNTEDATVAAVQCEIDQASGFDCADAKTEKVLTKRLRKAGKLLAKLGKTTKAKKVAKLQSALDKLLAGLSAKVAGAAQTEADCKAEIQTQLSAIRAMVGDVGGAAARR
jgi:hypothetical protein